MIWNPILRALWRPVAVILAFAAVYAFGRRDARQRAEIEAVEASVKTIKEVRRHEHEAETQDDPALVARLTRNR